MSALAAKAYSAASQAVSALHTMALLQVHQVKALKSFALWAIKVMALISLYSPYFIVSFIFQRSSIVPLQFKNVCCSHCGTLRCSGWKILGEAQPDYQVPESRKVKSPII